MRITVLTHLEEPGSRTIDPAARQVAGALEAGGHAVSLLAVHDEVEDLVRGLSDTAPELVFNLMETFGKTQLGAVAVAGLLDLLGVGYVGGGPGELYLQEDKGLTKKLLAFDGLRFPDFAVFPLRGGADRAMNARPPWIVKPLRMDASIGIDPESVVGNEEDARRRVAHVHETIGDSALVEEYVEGREFHVGVLGNAEPAALPPIEIDFSGLPEGAPRILDHRAKWVKGSAEFRGTKAVVADIPEELASALADVAVAGYRALRVKDYGRVDLRWTGAGEIHVIEVNASCYLERSAEFAMAAAAAGLEFRALVNRIVEVAAERYA